MRIVTFNVRCNWVGDGINSFVHRAGLIYGKIREERPDIIAFQEVTPKIADFLSRMLADIYDVRTCYRSESFDGEGLTVALRRDSFALDGIDYFWLSPTPDVPGSRFPEQSRCPRIAVLVKCREVKSGRIIRLCNTHLDHKSEEARVLGIKLLLSRLESVQSEHFMETVLLGDMNAEPGSDSIRACLEGSLGLCDLTHQIPITYHGFAKNPGKKIDYIFATGELAARASAPEIWPDSNEGIYLSDHYPIEIAFE